jgi:hypothetical protein
MPKRPTKKIKVIPLPLGDKTSKMHLSFKKIAIQDLGTIILIQKS